MLRKICLLLAVIVMMGVVMSGSKARAETFYTSQKMAGVYLKFDLPDKMTAKEFYDHGLPYVVFKDHKTKSECFYYLIFSTEKKQIMGFAKTWARRNNLYITEAEYTVWGICLRGYTSRGGLVLIEGSIHSGISLNTWNVKFFIQSSKNEADINRLLGVVNGFYYFRRP